MATHKIIFVSQEITPYLAVSKHASWGRELPQSIQSRKYEVRTFMPDFGDINERRNQLHEVIRLSGINVTIGDNDHPLIVKVASMQPSRIQVYFIDNEDYFQRLDSDVDSFGTNRADNDERLIFFTRGTVETVRKLRWEPETMQLSGWMSALIPLYVRHLFNEGPTFHDTKLVYTILDGDPRPESIDPEYIKKLTEEGVNPKALKKIAKLPNDRLLLDKIAIMFADAIVFQGGEPNPELVEFCESQGKKHHHFSGEGDHTQEYDELYQSLNSKA